MKKSISKEDGVSVPFSPMYISDIRKSICGNTYAVLYDEKGKVVLKDCYEYILDYVKRMGIPTWEYGGFDALQFFAKWDK